MEDGKFKGLANAITGLVKGVNPVNLGGELLDKGADIADRFLETKDEKREFFLELAKQQNEINLEQAKSKSFFVSGARPFIMWVCGVSLAYSWIIRDIVQWIFLAAESELPKLPDIDVSQQVALVTSLLGLYYLRGKDKKAGVG